MAMWVTKDDVVNVGMLSEKMVTLNADYIIKSP